MENLDLDVITIGRSSVDLYGNQVGGRLEDMASFAKYLGGSPTNTAAGASRLGLKSAVITAVGDEHMGRFIIEQLEREGVDTRGVKIDPQRLTALVILGIRDHQTFPLIFYRENCADLALSVDDIDPGFIRRARSVVLSGTHFSTARVAAMSRKAAEICRDNGGRIAFDVDYRPVLWGIGGHGSGEERYVKDGAVTEHLQAILPLCDLIVGTEEELHIVGGAADTLEALRAIRAKTDAAIVCKRGPMGCVVFPGDLPDSIEQGLRGPGFAADLFHVEDVLVNSIYVMGLRSLARLLGNAPEAAEFNRDADKTRDALLTKCWDEEVGAFFDLSGVAEKPLKEVTISSLMPLVLEDLPRPIVERLVDTWVTDPKHFWTPYPLPSVPASDPKFMPGNPRGFIWRGPSWINTNWFLSHALRRHGYADLADTIVVKSQECIEKSGFREYYEPFTAEGLGARDFGWSTLILDM